MRHVPSVRARRAPVPFALAFTLLAAAVAATAALAPAAHADPVVGHVETFPGTATDAWGGGDITTNPGTGGVDGDGDGYLHLGSFNFTPHLGAFSTGIDYAGDWIAANVNRVKLWLNDTDVPQNIEMHVCVGNSINLWESKQGFVPPSQAWAQFSLDVVDSTQFAHIIGTTGTFTQALQSVDRLLLRHDKAPFAKTPDTLSADVGIDNIETTNTLVGVTPLPAGVGRAVALAAPFPNPARDRVTCAFEAFDAGPIAVRVFDASGRLVRAEALAGAAPGPRTWVWDGRDDAGRTAPAGAYRVRVTGECGGTSRPFVLLR